MIPLPAKVYIASKMQHAEKWRDLYNKSGLHIVSRWPFLEPFVEPTKNNALKFWQDDVADIKNCDVLMIYAEENEHLRGALVEVGLALGLGKYVVVIGDHPDFGTWRYHPRVYNLVDLDQAINFIRKKPWAA